MQQRHLPHRNGSGPTLAGDPQFALAPMDNLALAPMDNRDFGFDHPHRDY
jgi:hypothetical protein